MCLLQFVGIGQQRRICHHRNLRTFAVASVQYKGLGPP